jgi:hypothetical protein
MPDCIHRILISTYASSGSASMLIAAEEQPIAERLRLAHWSDAAQGLCSDTSTTHYCRPPVPLLNWSPFQWIHVYAAASRGQFP